MIVAASDGVVEGGCGVSRERGFSLLEVIAAILLLAIAFGAVIRVSASSMQLTSRAVARSRAAMWADSKIEMLGRTESLMAGSTEGRFDTTYRWRATVTREASNTYDLHLYRVDLEVIWTDVAGSSSMHATTLRIRDEAPPVVHEDPVDEPPATMPEDAI
jgi:general secretion pathway protein I